MAIDLREVGLGRLKDVADAAGRMVADTTSAARQLVAVAAGPRSLPERGLRAQVRLPRDDEPRPHRAGPPAVDHALETPP